tara:strand:- start:96 stop:314 length:219 start_codon:yes stop_codon:yes gene_type:complete
MDVTIQIKNNYGQDVAYPVCSNAKLFAEVAGTKTLTTEVLKRIMLLGFVIKFAPQDAVLNIVALHQRWLTKE